MSSIFHRVLEPWVARISSAGFSPGSAGVPAAHFPGKTRTRRRGRRRSQGRLLFANPRRGAIVAGFCLLLAVLDGTSPCQGAIPAIPAQLPPPAAGKAEFVRDIQPILAARCYACHGPDKQENDLRWDSKISALKGGSSGPAIIPGRSADSRMIRLVAGLEPGLVMPKKGSRLTAEQIGLLRAWIDQGANWPEAFAEPKPPNKADWWSFKPAVRPALPAVKNQKWARNPIDLFILAKLEQEGLEPSPEANRRTLIRRLSFDLTGLPPSPEEVDSFVRERDKFAYEKLVDRLLASPRYGERWARHWLDTVHYADTHGYDKDKTRPNAWRYRDYVIASFNQDKSYTRFVQEQLAGDVLFPNEPDGIIGLGFIAAGPWDYVGHIELPIEKTDGLIARYNDRDDMAMSTMSTFQSLTVHCARCHDHKFDPIMQRDYYGLQAVFAGVDRNDRPFDWDKTVLARRRALLAQKMALEDQYTALTNSIGPVIAPKLKAVDEQLEEMRKQRRELANEIETEKSPGNGFRSSFEHKPDVVKWVQIDLGAPFGLDEVRLFPARPADYADTLGFGFPPGFRVEISDDPDFKTAEPLADHNDFQHRGDDAVNIPAKGKQARYVRLTATRLWQGARDYVFALAELQVLARGTNIAFGKEVSSSDSFEGGLWSRRFLVDGFDSRARLPHYPPTPQTVARDELEEDYKALKQERTMLSDAFTSQTNLYELASITNEIAAVDQEIASLPPPERVYAANNYFSPAGEFEPARRPRPVHLLARGDVRRPGDLMAPAGVAAVPGPNPKFRLTEPDDEGSRRAALALWITDPKNMLTRRSIVNRVWHYHFGRGIVETPNDFGHMGALPTHPELLDWLAFWFLDNGESLKKLHRLIVTSATYRQSSLGAPALTAAKSGRRLETRNSKRETTPRSAAELDADNRYLWRMNRSRLDAECIRDSLLLITGKLDLTMGGPGAQQFYFKEDHSPVYDYSQFDVDSLPGCRRSIYRFIVRSVPDPLMETLDCPDASLLTPKRNVTMTSLQALAVLNDPFVIRQSEHLAERVAKAGSLSRQIEQAYRLALDRTPTQAELKKLEPYARQFGMANLCRLIFNMSEFMFVD